MGCVLSVVKTVLLENIVTNVRNLHHHIPVILVFFSQNEKWDINLCLFFSYYSACDTGTYGENCAFQCSQNCNGTCGYIDGSCTACKIGWKGYNCSEGKQNNDICYLQPDI